MNSTFVAAMQEGKLLSSGSSHDEAAVDSVGIALNQSWVAFWRVRPISSP